MPFSSYILSFIFCLLGSFFTLVPLYAQESPQEKQLSLSLSEEEDTLLSKDLSLLLEEPSFSSNHNPSLEETSVPLINHQKAVVSLLDKITGRVKTQTVSLNTSHTFGRLQFVVLSCYQSRPEDTPESIAFIEISEQDPLSKIQQTLFHNWMYASSPSISALDHPIYDIWLKGCE